MINEGVLREIEAPPQYFYQIIEPPKNKIQISHHQKALCH